MTFSRLPESLSEGSGLWVTIPVMVLRPPYTKVAISLPSLLRQTNAFSVKRRPGCEARLKRSRPKELFLEYNVTCHEKDSDPAGHDVQVQFNLEDVEKTQDAKRLDVRCSCSCVAPGTMIKMADGTEKPIEQIQVGDWVITHKGRARQVTAIMSRPARDGERAWETKAEGYRDPLILSDDHPLGVIRGHELCACGCGEPLSPMGYKNVTFRQRWARKFIKGHYRRGEDSPDVLSQGKFNWKVPFELVNRECLYFPKIAWTGTEAIDLNFASLTGYYLAEGHVPASIKKKGRWGNELTCEKSEIISYEGNDYRVRNVIFTLNQNERFTLAADIEFKAKEFCGSNVEIKTENHESGRDKWLTVTVKDKHLAAMLIRAVGRGSLKKKLSQWVLGWSPESMMALVSSYALGDGYLSDDSQSVFSVSRDLISQISMFLFSLGIWHGWTYHRKKGTKNTQFRLNWNYRDYPRLFEEMKSRMREEDKARASERLEKNECWGDCRDREWNGGFLHSLRSKHRVDAPAIFHDLTVDEDESFIANGCSLHNCPAFLYWGQQWNLHQRDALLGEPRPLLQAPTERLDLRANAVICKHCLAPDSMVLMADGTEKRIDEVQVGDWVITHKGRARQITAISKRPAKQGELAAKTYAKGCSEPLVTSKDHDFATVRGNEVCFCGCKGRLPYDYRGLKWDRKYLQGHGGKGHPPSKLSVSDIQEVLFSKDNQDVLAARFKVSQTTISRIRNRVERLDDPDVEDCSKGKLRWLDSTELSSREFLYFPKFEWQGMTPVDLGFASLLGYYLAEGSPIMARSGVKYQWRTKKASVCEIKGESFNVYGINFTLNQDEEHTLAADIVRKLRLLLGDNVDVSVTPQFFKKRKWLRVSVNHAGFAIDMMRLGGWGSKHKRLSPEAWSWNIDAIRELIASYALGDGHLDESGQQYVFSISRPLISQVSTILFSLGVWNGHLYQDWQGKKSVGKRKKNRYHQLYWNYRRYPQVLDKMRGRLRPHVLAMVDSAKDHTQGSDYWEDGFLRCVYGIEEVPAPSYFHDISVDEDESFIANRIVVHNCKTVFERILPAVQHNIVNIVREKEVEKNKERLEEQPPSPKEKKLQERQEEMRKRKEIEEIVKTKDEDEQKKMIDELLEEEEKKLKKPVEEPEAPEAPSPEPPLARPPRPAPAPAPPKQNVVQRDEPAATPPPPAPTPAAPEKPDLADLIRKEEKRLQKSKPRKLAPEETLKRKRTSLEASLLEKLTSDKLQRWDSKFSDKEAVKKLSSFDRTDSRSFLKSVEVLGQAFLNKTAEELYVVRRGDGVTLTDPATKDECVRWVYQHGAEAGVVGGNFLNLAIEEARPGESRWMPQFTEDDLKFMDQLKISAVMPLARPGQDIQVLQRSDTWLDLVKAKQQRERLASPEEAEQSLAKDILRQFPSHKVALGMLATMCEMNDRNWPDQDYLYTREGNEVGTEDFEIALDLSLHDLRYRPDNWAGTAKKLLTAALRRWTPNEMEREASLYEGYDGCQSDDSSPGFGYAKDFNWSQVDEFPVSRIEKGSGIRWKGEWKRYREEPYYKDMEKWWTKKPNEHVIIVRGNDGKYYIWDGYHRTAIAKSHGMKSVPAFVGTSKEGKTASSPVEKDAKGTPQEVADLMMYRSFGEDAKHKDYAIYSRHDGEISIMVRFRDGRVRDATCTMVGREGGTSSKTKEGFQGVWEFAQSWGD